MIFSSLYGTRLDRELGVDDSTVLFTTARRKSAINEAMAEFADLTGCCRRYSTVQVTGGTAEYDLHSTLVIAGGDFLRWSDEQVRFRYTDTAGTVQVLTGPDLPRRTVTWLNTYETGWANSTVTSTVLQLPQCHYERMDGSARWVGLWPTPGIPGSSVANSSRGLLTLPYLARPAAMTSDAAEPFTFNSSVRIDLRPYHQALAHGGASLLEKLRKDTEASARQWQVFLGYVARYLGSMRIPGGRQAGFLRRAFQTTRNADRGTDPRV